MFAELHSLLSSGLDFSRSFSLLIEGERNAAGRALLTELYRSVVRGESLGRAFERSERFAPLDCGVLRIGEETGRLDEALAFLADYYGKRIAQRRMVSGAVSYPLIILSRPCRRDFHGTGHRTDVRTGLLAHGRRTPGHDPMDHFAVKSVSGVPGRHSIHGARRMVLVEDFRWTTRSAAYGWQSAAADALVGRHAA